jgi:hypothetical protein
VNYDLKITLASEVENSIREQCETHLLDKGAVALHQTSLQTTLPTLPECENNLNRYNTQSDLLAIKNC